MAACSPTLIGATTGLPKWRRGMSERTEARRAERGGGWFDRLFFSDTVQLWSLWDARAQINPGREICFPEVRPLGTSSPRGIRRPEWLDREIKRF